MMKEYKYRHLAKIVVEAESPLAIGTGSANILTDSPVTTDINGLPFIPATSMAGVIRHALADDNLFGFQDAEGGEGSKIIFTDAVMIGKDGKAVDGLSDIDFTDDFYRNYANMPVRQHVRMNHCGTAEKSGKFDGQVVYKGTRFVFEIEIVSETDDIQPLHNIIGNLSSAAFRIGGGTRKGYGKLKIIDRLCKIASVNLSNNAQLDAYLSKSALLSKDWKGYNVYKPLCDDIITSDWTIYKLTLKAADFTLFGSGLSDDDADNVSVTEPVVKWNVEDGVEKPQFTNRRMLIPASSVKGAIAHRTAYHYNKLTGYYATEENLKSAAVNTAVNALFGSAGQNGNDSQRGNVLISDIFGNEPAEKVLHHVKIDYFTGGAIDGALFQEKTVVAKNKEFELEILVSRHLTVDCDNDKVYKAFEAALLDLCEGLLPLGGATNRGYGIFSGELSKNGEIIYPK